MTRAPVFLLMMGIACTVPALGELESERPTPCPGDECIGQRSEGFLRLQLSYATFRPGCLTVKVEDRADPSKELLREVKLGSPVAQSKQLAVAVFREEGWSQELVLTATAYEGPCTAQSPRPVDTETSEGHVPEKGEELVSMSLLAEDGDDDGFVRADQGGSDCDDDDKQVKPGVTEICDNGRDDNCSGDETDAIGVVRYYPDADKDGFGDPQRQLLACATPPTGHVTNNRDCDDSNATVRPDQPETLCDGRDDNCNDVADDTFNVGMACTTNQACAGMFVCQSQTSSACVSSLTPNSWFLDEDGDQRPGTSAGMSCVAPAPGAANQSSDCDDTSPFSFNGGTERCDRLDNDCDNATDEGCATKNWQPLPGTNNETWRAVASYAQNKAWAAGSGNALSHVDGTTITSFTDCQGNWVSAWANPSDGRVFLGSDSGVLATRTPGGTGCQTVPTGRSSSVNGLVGFGNGASATLFAVTSEGRIFRWEYPGTGTGTVSLVAQVAANLRDIHGTSPANLVAVGAELVNSTNEARAFATNPATGAWSRETLPNTLPSGMFLRAVHLVHGQRAYAAGDDGVVLQRVNGTWGELPRLASLADSVGVVAYGRTAVYVVSTSHKEVYFFNGFIWVTDHTDTRTLASIDGVGPHDLWVVGSSGSILRRGP
jgi:hypothetical protein